MKKFNSAGTCIRNKHYMVDTTDKLEQIIKLVEDEEYFTINRPRQYGKTTTLYLLNQKLNDKYLVLRLSFERVDQNAFVDSKAFITMFYLNSKDKLEFLNETQLLIELEGMNGIDNFDDFSRFLTKFIKNSPKEIILMIDEVDAASNNDIFIKFLAVLRDKYLRRNEGVDYTFKSVILAGVHDIKNLKYKIRGDGEDKFNSPWNIAVDFDIDMSFNAEEIKSLLLDYLSEHREVTIDIDAIANRIHYFTNGFPFLVSYICKIIDEELDIVNKWSPHDVDMAVKVLIGKKKVTNFESLIKNLENNSDLYSVIERVLIDGEEIPYTTDDPIIDLADTYGMIKNKDGRVAIDNLIYEQRIFNYITSKKLTNREVSRYNAKEQFIDDSILNVKLILERFQIFLKETYSSKDDRFIEREGRLLFLSFIRPIINGHGFAYLEARVGEERRIDVVINYLNQRYVVELKIWYGEAAHQRGLKQLNEYLDLCNLKEGYMLIFDFNKNKQYTSETITYDNKEMFIIRV